MNTFSKFLLVLCLGLIISCEDDDANEPLLPEGDYFNGVIVLNEGGSAGGSISFASADFQEVETSIFASANDGEGPGLFLQSIFFEGDRAFIISNGSNKISVVNRFTFELLETIDTDLSVPRYGTVLNGKAYVTNLDAFDTDQDDYVAVINLETLEVEDTVTVGATAEHIVNANGNIYIQNAAFGNGNRISVLNPENNTIDDVIEVGEGLNSLLAFNNQVYALDSDGVKVINTTDSSIETQIQRPEGLASANNLRIDSGQLYYTSGTAAYTSSLSNSELSSDPLFDYGSESAFGAFYGFQVNQGVILIGDAGDFSSDGTVFVYSNSGELLSDFNVDIAPNNFYFQ